MKEVKEQYHDNGHLKWRRNYLNCKPHGLSERWWPSGELNCRSNYFNGKLCGLSECWRSDDEQDLKYYRLL